MNLVHPSRDIFCDNLYFVNGPNKICYFRKNLPASFIATTNCQSGRIFSCDVFILTKFIIVGT